MHIIYLNIKNKAEPHKIRDTNKRQVSLQLSRGPAETVSTLALLRRQRRVCRGWNSQRAYPWQPGQPGQTDCCARGASERGIFLSLLAVPCRRGFRGRHINTHRLTPHHSTITFSKTGDSAPMTRPATTNPLNKGCFTHHGTSDPCSPISFRGKRERESETENKSNQRTKTS